jgi:site-specific recombinase XerC
LLVSSLLGHAAVSFTESVYTHLTTDHAEEAAAVIDGTVRRERRCMTARRFSMRSRGRIR